MRIGIIGAGQIGGTLTRRLAKLGHQVSVANSRGPETLAALARETGAKAVTVAEAARAGEVVVVTIPEAKVRNLPKNLFEGVLTMWWLWTQATTTLGSATAVLKRLKQGCRRADGLSASWGGRW